MNGLRITLAAGVAAALACTSWSSAARADEEKGLAIGARVAYAVPFGDAQQFNYANDTRNISMSAQQRGMLPIWFDLGYRFNRSLFLGLFYQYAPTFPLSHSCVLPSTIANPVNGELTCDGFEQRFGVEVQYHLRPTEMVDPWIGLGLGVEMSQLNYSQGQGQDTGSFQAWAPQADLQLGADLGFSKRIPVGPFVDLSLAQFGTENTYDPNNHGSPVAFNAKLHGWFTFGLRAQFNL